MTLSETVRKVLYIIVCGGRPAADIPTFARYAAEQGWDPCVIATPAALKFIDADEIRRATGHPVRYDYKQPDEPDVLPAPHAYVVAPATFNTINKWAAGMSDTLALGLLNEAVGLKMPIVAVPFVNSGLAQHPAFVHAVRELRQWGVDLLFEPQQFPLPLPNQGPSSREMFPWTALRRKLHELRSRVGEPAWRTP